MSGSRPLLARTSSGEFAKDGDNTTPTPGSHRNPSGGRPKRTLIESACSACRRRKSRCDGQRPSCSRCQNLRTDCQYEAEEGESRWSALRRRNQILEQERDQLRELLSFVQTMPEPEAQEIFRHIRMSNHDEVFALLRQIKEGMPAIQPNLGSLPLPSTTGPEQRLPPIQAILGDASRGMTPAHLTHSHSLSSEDSRSSSAPDIGFPGPHHVPAMEARLQQGTQSRTMGPPGLFLSSEESASSVGSTSNDPTRPYATP